MHGAWQRQSGDEPDIGALTDSLKAANPPCKSWLQQLAQYAVSTDAGGSLLRDLAHASKTMAPKGVTTQGRFIGSELFDKILAIKDCIPYLKNAALKCQVTGHATVDRSAESLSDGPHANTHMIQECQCVIPHMYM